MKYICDTGDEQLDAMLRVLLEHYRGTAEDEVLLVTEESCTVSDGYTAVIVLYSDDRYTYSAEHRELTKRYGEKYRAVQRPIDIAAFCEVVRRMNSGAVFPGIPSDEDERVIYEGRTVTYRGRSASLTAREDELFRVLYEHCGSVVSRERITVAVWGSEVATNVADVYMSYLRRKLTSVFGKGVLSSVRGEGYILKLPGIGE